VIFANVARGWQKEDKRDGGVSTVWHAQFLVLMKPSLCTQSPSIPRCASLACLEDDANLPTLS
jgi:hypothetical protein